MAMLDQPTSAYTCFSMLKLFSQPLLVGIAKLRVKPPLPDLRNRHTSSSISGLKATLDQK